jgi:anti-sigma B factor antagonist
MAELAGGDGSARVEIERDSDSSGAPVIAVSGELDISNAGELEEAITAVAATEPKRLVFDLARLRFIDSAGIAVLLRATRAAADVSLRDPSPAVRKLVELTGLADVLSIEP